MIDIDGTLAELHDQNDLDAWRAEVTRRGGELAPVVGAVEALAIAPACRVVLVTCRREDMRALTAAWIARHFPSLVRAPLVMRAYEDERPSAEVRLEQIEAQREGDRVVLVDNEPDSASALWWGDCFILAPSAWPDLQQALKDEPMPEAWHPAMTWAACAE